MASLALLLGLAGAAAAGVWGVLNSEAGTRWLLRQVPGVEQVDNAGGLLSPTFELRQLRFSWGTQGAHLELAGLRWEGLKAQWLPRPGTLVALHAQRVQARSLSVNTGASDGKPMQAMASLHLPLDLRVDAIQVERLAIDTLLQCDDLLAQLSLGDAQGSRHLAAIQLAQCQAAGAAQGLQLTATAEIMADAPLRLNASANARGDAAGWPFLAELGAQGPLASFDLRAHLQRLTAPPSPDDAALDIVAQVRPFERWPLGDVSATTRSLDLAALAKGAPRTQLTGHVVVRSQGLREPVSADIQIDNAAAQRLDAGGLPLLSLRARLQADPRQPERIAIGPFDIQAADAQGSAGRWAGTGLWDGRNLQVDSRVTELQPARLDGRLAAMRLSGPLQFQLKGMPSPNPQAPDRAAFSWSSLTAALQTRLAGNISGAPQEVRLEITAVAERESVNLQRVLASSGNAQLEFKAELKHLSPATRNEPPGAALLPGQRWQLHSEGRLAAFDPSVWFPGVSELRAAPGTHLLNGRWSLGVTLPVPDATIPWTRWLPQWQGQADVKLADSRWAGLPLSADMQLGQDNLNPSQRSRAKVDLRWASSQFTLDGSADPLGDGQSDRTELRLSAPALAEVRALLQPYAALRTYTPTQGSLQLQAEISGRWPALRTDWQGLAVGLRTATLALDRAEWLARWDRQRADEIELRADVQGLRQGEARVDQIKAEVTGTLASHRFQAQVGAPLQPPPALSLLLDWGSEGAAQGLLQGQGHWQPDTTGGGGIWRFLLDRLELGKPASREARKDTGQWLRAQAVAGELSFSDQGLLRAASLQPGRLESGALNLGWSEARWQLDGAGPARFAVKGQLEPVLVASLLNRAVAITQRSTTVGTPQQTWAGDLRLGATLDLRANPALEIDFKLQRSTGDLLLRDGSAELPLGIEQAGVSLMVRNGLWRLSPNLQGKALGLIDGEAVLRTAPQDRWPAPSATLSGRLRAEVASLAAWGSWMPPGWRLSGQTTAEAMLDGSLANPQFKGHIEAQGLALRNPLQGIDLQDGSLRIALDGEQARIERASIRGGSGRLKLEGSASLGAATQLRLRAQADKLRVLGRLDRQLTLSGQASLLASANRVQVEGKIAADSGLFDLSQRDAPTLDEDVDVRQSAETVAEDLPRREPSGLAKQLELAVELDLGRQMRLRGRGLDTQLQGSVKLSSPGGRLSVLGQVKAVDGTYAAYGQKLGIERGLVFFEGPLDRTRLDVLALRPNLDQRVGVAISGSALDPRVRLYSDPDLPESDKLSWLVLGRGPEGLGRTDTALLQRAAMALLAGESRGPADGVLRRLGIDDFSIRQSDGEVRETVVTVGKQLSRRWYVGYERGVNAATGTWQLVYRIAQRFTLRAQSGLDNSLDMIWTWRFATQAQRQNSAEER